MNDDNFGDRHNDYTFDDDDDDAGTDLELLALGQLLAKWPS